MKDLDVKIPGKVNYISGSVCLETEEQTKCYLLVQSAHWLSGAVTCSRAEVFRAEIL